MSLTIKEISMLALLAQKHSSVKVDLDEVGLSGPARNYAELLLAPEKIGEPVVVRDMRQWARSIRRDR